MTAHGDTSVLVVDDDAAVGRMVFRVLERAGYTCGLASSATEARSALHTTDYQIVLCDVSMPGESGLELVATLTGRQPETAVVMMSGNDDPARAATAIELGAYGYLIKPLSANQLVISVDNAAHRRRLELSSRAMASVLREQVTASTQQLAGALKELERSRLEVIRRLTRAVEFRDSDTGHHIERIADLSARIAALRGCPQELVNLIRVAAPMHDVGKLGIADAMLQKAGPLTDGERREMERHAQIGYAILSGSGMELLDLAASIALSHHEWWDGSGYPDGLVGEQIPLEGRIVAVADVFDALTSNRVYHSALSDQAALALMRDAAGSHFDPDLIPLLELVVAHERRPGPTLTQTVAPLPSPTTACADHWTTHLAERVAQ